MREKILGLAHFIEPVFPQKLAILSDKIWGCGYHSALSIIKYEMKKDVLTILPHTGKVMYLAENIEKPEEDPIIRSFMEKEDIDKIMKVADDTKFI